VNICRTKISTLEIIAVSNFSVIRESLVRGMVTGVASGRQGVGLRGDQCERCEVDGTSCLPKWGISDKMDLEGSRFLRNIGRYLSHETVIFI
jgi:hypothetical protein